MSTLHPDSLQQLVATHQRDLLDEAQDRQTTAAARAARKAERLARRAARRSLATANNAVPALTREADVPSPAVAT